MGLLLSSGLNRRRDPGSRGYAAKKCEARDVEFPREQRCGANGRSLDLFAETHASVCQGDQVMMTISAVTILLDRIEGRSFDQTFHSGDDHLDDALARTVAERPGILRRMLARMTGRLRETHPNAAPVLSTKATGAFTQIPDHPSPNNGPEQARKLPEHELETAPVYPRTAAPRHRATVEEQASKAA
jgi:hypothetical protein